MSAKDTLRSNKTAIVETLCGDKKLILNKVHEEKIVTEREYKNLKRIEGENVESHIIELVDKIMGKGEDTCRDFLNLLQTDDDVKSTFPELKNILKNDTCRLPRPVQATHSGDSDGRSKESNRRKGDDQYQLNSRPVGLCVIINNENFTVSKRRDGTNKDAQSLAEVFSLLGFRVLMCKDQTRDQMDRALKVFASLDDATKGSNDVSQLQEFNVEEWSGSEFTSHQGDLKHGDAFICCVLSHGSLGEVLGTDEGHLSIKQMTRTFKATDHSALTGKPKVFLIQACQGGQMQQGVLSADLQTDDSESVFTPQEADFLVAFSTVEDHKSLRHETDGSWFIQSVCEQLREGCLRGEDVVTILHRVNSEVSQKKGITKRFEIARQMPEVRFTLRKKLVLSPHDN